VTDTSAPSPTSAKADDGPASASAEVTSDAAEEQHEDSTEVVTVPVAADSPKPKIEELPSTPTTPSESPSKVESPQKPLETDSLSRKISSRVVRKVSLRDMIKYPLLSIPPAPMTTMTTTTPFLMFNSSPKPGLQLQAGLASSQEEVTSPFSHPPFSLSPFSEFLCLLCRTPEPRGAFLPEIFKRLEVLSIRPHSLPFNSFPVNDFRVNTSLKGQSRRKSLTTLWILLPRTRSLRRDK